jgi:CheY-like chemotaxis protein
MEALHKRKVTNRISVTRDGEQAIQFLNQEGDYSTAERPDRILLDINLPRIDGKEVRTYVKSHPSLKSIPVVMLTTSSSEKDILEAYKNYANCYISKPVNRDKFFDVVQKIGHFWISIVHLPKND